MPRPGKTESLSRKTGAFAPKYVAISPFLAYALRYLTAFFARRLLNHQPSAVSSKGPARPGMSTLGESRSPRDVRRLGKGLLKASASGRWLQAELPCAKQNDLKRQQEQSLKKE